MPYEHGKHDWQLRDVSSVEVTQRLVSVNSGSLQEIDVRGRRVQTSIFKRPVAGPRQVTKLGLVGDTRAEPRKMGETEHAVYAYPYEHYAYWAERLGMSLELGQFGENLTLTGCLETCVRIGDVLECGTTRLQVAHPRIPCRKLDVRMGFRFSRDFLASLRVGYYLRVLQPGTLQEGDTVRLVQSTRAAPTVTDFVRLTQFDYWDALGLEELLAAPHLVSSWREIIESKLARASSAQGWFGLRALEVVDCVVEAGVVSLRLRCSRGRSLPRCRPGQHLPLSLGNNLKQRVLGHAYPVIDEGDVYRIAGALPASSQGNTPQGWLTRELLTIPQLGEQLMAGAPRGHELLSECCANGLFITEGLGLVLPASLPSTRENSAAKLKVLHYRNGASPLAMEQDLAQRAYVDLCCHEVGPPADASIAEALRDALDVVVCGTDSFVDQVLAELEARDAASVHVVRFR